jgi:hypothetical protein
MKWKEQASITQRIVCSLMRLIVHFVMCIRRHRQSYFVVRHLCLCMSVNYILPIGYFYILFYYMVGLGVKYNTLNKLDTVINADNGGFFDYLRNLLLW